MFVYELNNKFPTGVVPCFIPRFWDRSSNNHRFAPRTFSNEHIVTNWHNTSDVPLKSNPAILRKIVGNLSPSTGSPSVVVQASTAFTALNDIFDRRIMEPSIGKGLKVYVDNTIGIWNVQSGNGKV
jgi:hypothetical protein